MLSNITDCMGINFHLNVHEGGYTIISVQESLNELGAPSAQHTIILMRNSRKLYVNSYDLMAVTLGLQRTLHSHSNIWLQLNFMCDMHQILIKIKKRPHRRYAVDGEDDIAELDDREHEQ